MKPFTENPKEQLQGIGESALLSLMLEWFGGCVLPPPIGPGNDCAVLPSLALERVITTDPVWYLRHFDDSLSPEAVGRKLVVRNLSDLAASGSTPEGALLSLFAPGNTSLSWLERCCRSIGKTCNDFGLHIAGGDIAQSINDLGLNLTAWGVTLHTVPGRGKVLPGDSLWVTGQLGGSLLGHHWKFIPRLEEGRWLTGSGRISAMMDLSDGLASDLPRLLGPEHRASLNLSTLPLRPEAHKLSQTSGKPAWLHAWADGEDYELLFALRDSCDPEEFIKEWKQVFKTPLHKIGAVLPAQSGAPRFDFEGDCIPPVNSGYEHFKPNDPSPSP